MKPVTLTVAAFGPYLDEQTIDFRRLGEHGLFLIHGRTGSGKSSILDALCFALYGETTGGERDGHDMVTTLDRGAETKVVLEFEHGGERYKVTRYPTQEVARVRGEGLRTRQTEATLENLSAGEVVAAKARDVTSAVKEMLRCDVDQFRQTVVLPQGDFRRVVTDDGSRREILARIFRTERFADLAERLKEYAKGLAQQGRDIREQRQRLLADLGADNVGAIVEKLNRAEAGLITAFSLRDAARAAKDKALENRTAGLGLHADFADMERLSVRAAELSAESERMKSLGTVVERATRAAALADSRDHLDQRAGEHRRMHEGLDAAEETLAKARMVLTTTQAGMAELEAAERSALQSAEARFSQLDGQRENVAGVVDKQRAEEALALELAEAQARQQAAAAAVEALRSNIKALEDEAASLAARVADLDPARELYAAAQGDVEAATELATLQGEVKEVDDLIEVARTTDARGQLETAVRVGAPGLLAGHLGEGEPCPVCGSVHHPAPSSSEDVEALTQAFEEFGRAAAHGASLVERRRGLVSAMATVRERRGWADPAPARLDLVSAERVAAERKAAAEGAKIRSDEIATTVGHLRRDREERQAAHSGLAAEVGRLQGLIQRLEGEIAGALRALPEECRDPAAFEARLEESRARAEHLGQRFAEAARAVNEAALAEAKAATAAHSLRGQLATAGEALERVVQEFGTRLAKEGFVDRGDFEAAELEPDELAAHRASLGAYHKEVMEVEAGKAALGHKLAGKERPDLDALELALTDAQGRAVEAEAAATEAARRRDIIKRGHELFKELESRDALLAQRRTAAVKLDQLANGQLAGRTKVKLETFVLQSIFHEVLDEGNRHLRHMTGGRYTLLLRESSGASASGLELDVRDNAAGTDTRPVTTLSGGEGFLASLALALGLSEVAQRRSGGLELGALFIDEGFGSLDAQALDQVVDILRGLQDGHRMVGVISHVEELKRRIPAQLHVIPGRRGSTVEMRLNA